MKFVAPTFPKQITVSPSRPISLFISNQGEELAQLDKRVIALSLLSRLPVISCCCSSADALPAAAAATGDTWPVFHMPHMPEDVRPLVKVGAWWRAQQGYAAWWDESVGAACDAALGPPDPPCWSPPLDALACLKAQHAWRKTTHDVSSNATQCEPLQWLREELPRVRALSTAIADDLKVCGAGGCSAGGCRVALVPLMKRREAGVLPEHSRLQSNPAPIAHRLAPRTWPK
mgnify:CR=1 FL=1